MRGYAIMRLFLIRHGQSTNNALEDFSQRVVDPLLTPLGEKQAQHLADYALAHPHQFGINEIYASSMVRALQTAQPLATALGLPIRVWCDIHEFGGMYSDGASEDEKIGHAGMTRAEIQTQFPQALMGEDITDKGWYDVNLKMESVSHFIMRTVRVLHALQKRAKEDVSIALVSHGLFMDGLMKAIMRQTPTPPAELFYLFHNTSVTRVEFHEVMFGFDERIRLHYLNRLQHLPVDMWSA
jgi:2,3-bisphosphoglycerate-dependent phosphoglycerate mutase